MGAWLASIIVNAGLSYASALLSYAGALGRREPHRDLLHGVLGE
jgi:hypothetical protein